MEEVEDELRKIHGEDGLEEPGLKFDQHSNAEVTLEEENELVQDNGAADQISEHEEENLFTYEVCQMTNNDIFIAMRTSNLRQCE
jgi:hypothetical protein